MIAAETASSAPFTNTLKKGLDYFESTPSKPTVAFSIAVSQGSYAGLKAIRDSKGATVPVTDDEIMDMQKILASKEGIYAEPSSVAAVAGMKKLVEEGEPKPLVDLVSKMELLDRLQFLFYSQVLNIRSIDNSRILVRMLSHILRTSKNILDLNEEIHSLVATDSIGGHEEDETLISKIEDYMEKSRTLDHFFGNIADIMKGSS